MLRHSIIWKTFLLLQQTFNINETSEVYKVEKRKEQDFQSELFDELLPINCCNMELSIQ